MLMVNQLAGFGAVNGLPTIALTISSNQIATGTATGYDVFAQAGSPSQKVRVVVTVNSGVTVVNMRALGFASGSRVEIINNGDILGNGGNGANAYVNGTAGTDAIRTNVPTTITNNGNIWGGGGGGSGGGNGETFSVSGPGVLVASPPGGGGGGGQGYNGGAAGSGYPGYNTPAEDSSPGTSGSYSSAGVGGAGGPNIGFGSYGGNGGNGGGWGQDGSYGTNGWGVDNYSNTTYSIPPATVFGSAGKSVNTQGAGVTWVSGNNATQVKGATA